MVARTVYDTDHEDFRASVRQHVAAEVVPHLDAWRADGVLPREAFASFAEQGFLGIVAPEELGGGGIEDPRFTAVLVEEVAAVGALGLALSLALHSGVSLPFVLAHIGGSDHDTWVSGLATGEQVAAVAAQPTGPEDDPDGGDFLEVPGVVSGSVAEVVLLTLQEGGVAVLGGDAIAGRSSVTDALGARESGPSDLVVGGPVAAIEGDGLGDGLRRDLDLWIAVVAVASARAALDLTVAYVRERKVFGRPLMELENTRDVLASVGVRVELAQLAVDAALGAATEHALTARQAAAARVAAVEILLTAADEGMQLHGGYGYMREYPIAHAFADARALQLVAAAFSDPREVLLKGL